MQFVLPVPEVVELERRLADEGTSAAKLMARAGAEVARIVSSRVDRGPIIVLCGWGNNGGDGWVVADELAASGFEVQVVTPDDPSRIRSELARHVAEGVAKVGLPLYVDPTFQELLDLMENASCVVDAMVGSGSHGALRTPFDTWVRALETADVPLVVSVDLPSGVDARTGAVSGPAVTADITAALLTLKPGLVVGAGADLVGELICIPLADTEHLLADATACYVEDDDLFGVLPLPDPYANKYGRGTVLVVGGSERYHGAPILTARAAARTGAGYVTLAVPQAIADAARTHVLTIPVIGYGTGNEPDISTALERTDALVLGPGSRATDADRRIFEAAIAADVPLVLDAGAFELLGDRLEDYRDDLAGREAPVILTPHTGEFARMVDADPYVGLPLLVEEASILLARLEIPNLSILIKSVSSVLVSPGMTYYLPAGPASLATAGSGDVLAGIIGGVLAQDPVEPDLAIAAAVALQGRAALFAQGARGERSVIATDILDAIPDALVMLEEDIN